MHIEIVEAQWLDSRETMSLSDLAEQADVSETELSVMIDYGILAPPFDAAGIMMARKAKQLRDQFELDFASLALVMTLMNRIHDREAELVKLRAHFPDHWR